MSKQYAVKAGTSIRISPIILLTMLVLACANSRNAIAQEPNAVSGTVRSADGREIR